jgi:hypothetical protein
MVGQVLQRYYNDIYFAETCQFSTLLVRLRGVPSSSVGYMTGAYGLTDGIPFMQRISINSRAYPSKVKMYQKGSRAPVNMGRRRENPACMKDFIHREGGAQPRLTPFYQRWSEQLAM